MVLNNHVDPSSSHYTDPSALEIERIGFQNSDMGNCPHQLRGQRNELAHRYLKLREEVEFLRGWYRTHPNVPATSPEAPKPPVTQQQVKEEIREIKLRLEIACKCQHKSELTAEDLEMIRSMGLIAKDWPNLMKGIAGITADLADVKLDVAEILAVEKDQYNILGQIRGDIANLSEISARNSQMLASIRKTGKTDLWIDILDLGVDIYSLFRSNGGNCCIIPNPCGTPVNQTDTPGAGFK